MRRQEKAKHLARGVNLLGGEFRTSHPRRVADEGLKQVVELIETRAMPKHLGLPLTLAARPRASMGSPDLGIEVREGEHSIEPLDARLAEPRLVLERLRV